MSIATVRLHTWDKNGKISGSLGVVSSASFR